MSYVGIVQWLAAARQATGARGADADDHDGLRRRGLVVPWRRARVGLPAHLDRELAREPRRAHPRRPGRDRRGRRRRRDRALVRAVVQRAGRLRLLGRALPAPVRSPADLPALVIAGWYDCFLAGSLRSFANRERTRDRLIVGPWGHEPTLTHLVGERALGAAGDPRTCSTCASARWTSIARRWRARNPPGPRVLAYVLGGRAGSSSSRGLRRARDARRCELSGAGAFRAGPDELPMPAAAGACRAACRAADSARTTSEPLAEGGRAVRLDAAVPAGGLVATGRVTAQADGRRDRRRAASVGRDPLPRRR